MDAERAAGRTGCQRITGISNNAGRERAPFATSMVDPDRFVDLATDAERRIIRLRGLAGRQEAQWPGRAPCPTNHHSRACVEETTARPWKSGRAIISSACPQTIVRNSKLRIIYAYAPKGILGAAGARNRTVRGRDRTAHIMPSRCPIRQSPSSRRLAGHGDLSAQTPNDGSRPTSAVSEQLPCFEGKGSSTVAS